MPLLQNGSGQSQDLEASWEKLGGTVCIRLRKTRSFLRTENSVLILASSVLGLIPGRHLTGVDGPDWIQSPSGVLQCSASCGKGTQKRTVTCTNSQGKCDASTRPRAEEPCEDYSGCYEWKTGSWSKVSTAPALSSRPGSRGDSRGSVLSPWAPVQPDGPSLTR